jgi:hypothetical protein
MKKYKNRLSPETIVDYICEAEYRVGEIKEKVVIYQRNGKHYVRRKTEFFSRFDPAD